MDTTRVCEKEKNQFPFDTKGQNKGGSIRAMPSSWSVDSTSCHRITIGKNMVMPLEFTDAYSKVQRNKMTYSMYAFTELN